jgi:hypothetical protein
MSNGSGARRRRREKRGGDCRLREAEHRPGERRLVDLRLFTAMNEAPRLRPPARGFEIFFNPGG